MNATPLTKVTIRNAPVNGISANRSRDIVIVALGTAAVIILCGSFDPRRTDFRMFYSTAQMIRHGLAGHLYDLDLQHAFQLKFAGKIGLIFDYPPVSILPYVPGAWLSLASAYVLWTAVSTLLIAESAILLNSSLQLFKHPSSCFLVSLLFLPAWLDLMQGQIVAIILVAYALAFFFMMRRNDFACGCALGLSLIKFHLVLPFVFILLLRRRWRALSGFALVTGLFLLACVAVAGPGFLIAYPKMLMALSSLPQTGMHLYAMANLHGIAVGVLHHEVPVAAMMLISLLLLVLAATMWKNDPQGFATALCVTILVSYHLNPHDLLPLLVPALVIIKSAGWISWQSLTVIFAGTVVPFFLLIQRFWMTGFCVLVLLILAVCSFANRDKHSIAASGALHV